jgi:T5SS/PEP-CTERM-associated repeat protein
MPQTHLKRRGLHDDCQDVLGPTSTKHANAIRDHERDDYDKDQSTDPLAAGSSGSAVRAFVSGSRDFTVTDYALINVSPTAQINTGAASACAVNLGNYASNSGTLSVDGNGSSLTTCTGITVGNYGTGKLSITNGAAVTTNTVASIAWGTGSSGSATVDGTNGNTHSTWTVHNELDIGGTTNAAWRNWPLDGDQRRKSYRSECSPIQVGNVNGQ